MMTTADGLSTQPGATGGSGSQSRSGSGPSIHVVRARRLLLGGLCGGLVATVACLIIFTISDGGRGAVTTAISAAMVLFFYVVGQLVMVLFADAGARTLMLVSLASYTMRILVLGLILVSYNNNRANWPDLVPTAFFVTTIAVVAGWLAVEMIVFSRLRIGAYDTEYRDPTSDASEEASDERAGKPEAPDSAGEAR